MENKDSDNTAEVKKNLQKAITQARTKDGIIDIYRAIVRRKYHVITIFSLITIVSLIVIFQIPPRYTAKAQLMLNDRKINAVKMESVVSSAISDIMKIKSEVQVFKSRDLSKKVIKKTGLVYTAEFNPILQEKKGLLVALAEFFPTEWGEYFFEDHDQEKLSDEERKANELSVVVGEYLKQLKISNIRGTRVIQISFTSGEPRLAAKVANAVGDLYIMEQLESRFEATKRVSNWLNERLVALRKQVADSERAVEYFKEQHGLLTARKGVETGATQIAELNSQLIVARADRAANKAKLDQLNTVVKSGELSDLESISDVLSSVLIQKLREEEISLVSKISGYEEVFLERHPKMIAAKAELREVRNKLKVEVGRILKSIRSQVEIDNSRINSLKNDISRLEFKLAGSNKASVTLHALVREADANRLLFETFLARFKETNEQEGLHQSDARVISRAGVPLRPSYPKKAVMIVIATILGLLAGCGFVLVVDRLDKGFRSADQVEEITGLPGLGLIPDLRVLVKSNKMTPEKYIVKNPNSAYGEAIRSVKTSILLSDIDNVPKTILITSAAPNEGKTTIAMSLVKLAAMSGLKALYIEGDIRKPVLKSNADLGLVDILTTDETKISDAIIKGPSGAHYLVAGKKVDHPESLLGSRKMAKILKELEEVYDMIIIDSSPVLAVSDVLTLTPNVDKVIYVVQWEKTRRESATLGVKMLIEAGADVLGVLLSKVDVRKHLSYGYSDSGKYYSSEYTKYYASDHKV